MSDKNLTHVFLNNLKINSHTLDENFYSSIRKEINQEKLSYLSEISQNIPLPSLFGKFTSDIHYLDTVNLFIKSTEETRNRGVFFLRKILPLLQRKDKLLDIGPGNGKLTKWISRSFKEITLIDPVPQVLENISLSHYPNGKIIKKIPQSFLDTLLPKNYFDLIVLSHVLYHFPEKERLEVVKKSLSSLEENGVLVIVINGGLDRDKLGINFGGKTYSIENSFFKKLLLNKQIEIFSSKETFQAKDITTMLHICGLHLHDLKGEATKENLEEYIKANYLLRDNIYNMDMYQYFIVIKNEFLSKI